MYIGLTVNVGAPVAAFIIVTLALGKDIHSGGGLPFGDTGQLAVLFYAFLAVSLTEFATALILRRQLPRSLARTAGGTPVERFERGALTMAIIIYALNISHTVYGLVLAFLGANAQTAMLFVAFTLIGYQLFRLRRGFLERLYEQLTATDRRDEAMPT